MISKIILSLFFVLFLFQAHQVYGDEELPIITIDFVSGNIIDLDVNSQMIRADILIQNYNPQDGYHFMEVTRVSDGEIIKDTEIFPKFVGGADDSLYGVQILHYIEPDQNDEDLIGDYVLRIYSEYGTIESFSPFSIIKSSIPVTVTQTAVEESETSDESKTPEELVISEESTPDESETPDEYYDDLEYQLETFCDMTDEEQLDFFSENPTIIEFDEELVPICEIEDEAEREDALDDSIDTIILELRDNVEDNKESEIENLIQSESKIPSWVHDIFVWYANETISENELLAAIEYLITEGTINIDSN